MKIGWIDPIILLGGGLRNGGATMPSAAHSESGSGPQL
jgi:hypothetical protein